MACRQAALCKYRICSINLVCIRLFYQDNSITLSYGETSLCAFKVIYARQLSKSSLAKSRLLRDIHVGDHLKWRALKSSLYLVDIYYQIFVATSQLRIVIR